MLKAHVDQGGEWGDDQSHQVRADRDRGKQSCYRLMLIRVIIGVMTSHPK